MTETPIIQNKSTLCTRRQIICNTCHISMYQNNGSLAHNKCNSDNDLVLLQHYNKQQTKDDGPATVVAVLPATVASTATCVSRHLSNYSVLLQDTRGSCSQVTLFTS